MPWDVEGTDEFILWWRELSEDDQLSVTAGVDLVDLLEELGPTLPYPYSSGVIGSRHGHMRELRVQSGGRPIRILYAMDPRRTSILLIGGVKTSNKRFYEEYVPIADRLYDDHIEELREEGLIQ